LIVPSGEEPVVPLTRRPLGHATPAWDSNPLDSAQVIEIGGDSDDARPPVNRRMQPAKEDRTPQLAAAEELGMLGVNWLGVRDDFRNWLIRAA
jgi:hypothetical protein